MNSIFRIFLSLMILGLTAPVRAQEIVTINDYLKSEIAAGTEVRELLDVSGQEFRRYQVMDWEAILTPLNDPSQTMTQGTSNPNQGPIDFIRVKELLIPTDLRLSSGQTAEVLIKIEWKGRQAGAMDIALSGQHIVQGTIRQEPGQLRFVLTSVPDLIMIDHFEPSLDLATLFGYQLGPENDKIETEVKFWLESVINSVLPKEILSQPGKQGLP